MLDIQEHAYKLFKVFNFLDEGYFSVYEIPREWLNLSSGVAKVVIVPAMYDSTIYFCGYAMDREKERGKIWSEFTKALTIFNFAWGALESYIKIDIPKQYYKNGKEITKTVEKVKKYLKDIDLEVFDEYSIAYNQLHDLIQRKGNIRISKDYINSNPYCKGLILSKSIRNEFAHGARKLPDLDEIDHIELEDIDLVLDTKMINLSTRCILFIIQVLLIKKYSCSNLIIEFPTVYDFNVPEEYEEGISLIAILRSLHLNYVITNEDLRLDI